MFVIWRAILPSAIGLRQYKLFVTEKNSRDFVEPEDGRLETSLPDFVRRFFTTHAANVNEEGLERSWRIEERETDGHGHSRGIIRYGTYGFESELQDQDTGETNYNRRSTDIEVIPLYYEAWVPEAERFGLLSFQSFMGRSCISAVFSRMKALFEGSNDGFMLKMHKIMPAESDGAAFASRAVKGVTLVSRRTSTDLTDRLFSNEDAEHVRISLNVTAGRNKRLGLLSDLLHSVPADGAGVIRYKGIEFDDAVAHVRVGNKTRPVGVFGANRDVGVVDVTEDVVRGPDGHPTFDSIKGEADSILTSMYETLAGLRNED